MRRVGWLVVQENGKSNTNAKAHNAKMISTLADAKRSSNGDA